MENLGKLVLLRETIEKIQEEDSKNDKLLHQLWDMVPHLEMGENKFHLPLIQLIVLHVVELQQVVLLEGNIVWKINALHWVTYYYLEFKLQWKNVI